MTSVTEKAENGSGQSPHRRSLRWGPPIWHGTIAAIVAAPLMRGGYLLLLDFALVRRVAVVWLPTEATPGPVNGAPLQALLWLVARLGYAAGPLIVFALFLLMGFSAHRASVALIRPRHRVAAYFAGTLYAVNPFTYERLMQGHLFLLLAYGMLPLILLAATRFIEQPRPRTAAMLAASIMVVAWASLHVLVMLPLLFLATVAFRRATWRGSVLRWTGVVLVAVVIANAWWIVGLFRVQPGELVTARDIDAYATVPRSPAVIGNVAGLYGFWRHEFRLPKDGVEYWWLLFLPIGGVAAYGATVSVRDGRLRSLGIGLTILVPFVVLLAAGTSFAPTRGAFIWLFDNVPGFRIFREPQKWVALLPISYAFLGAVGLDRLLRPAEKSQTQDRRLLAAVGIAAMLLPLAYSWTLLWNWNRLRPVRFPSDWAAAERTMRNEGGGTMLFLPWHLYMTMSFTGHRVVNPAPSYFTGPVISGDNVELSGIFTQSQNPVSARIESVLFDPERRSEFENTVSDLCIRWVVMAAETDIQNYRWIEELPGFRKVVDGSTITVLHAERSMPAHCDKT